MFFYCLLFLYMVAIEPIKGKKDYLQFKREVTENPSYRISYYRKIIFSSWTLVILLLIGMWFEETAFSDIGLNAIRLKSNSFHAPVNSVFIGVLIGVIVALFLPVILSKYSKKYQDSLFSQLNGIEELLPSTNKERWWWMVVSLTAGITEEILYRGFLYYSFHRIFPGASIWSIVCLSAVIFGLAHAYQGIKGMALAVYLGAILGLIYIEFDSLLPAMFIHVLFDLRLIALLPGGRRREKENGFEPYIVQKKRVD
ncbi:type II CAAX endopeptidase family protein [Fictibacillus sp. Mic-4]|uniref:CPBP family intramembrane glutamic endopeptidase n=1 Tax=Fictibacillus TaxID=1329200 RepID=UPI000422EC58|nr:type II CAAX endopeptidase family protein [Fictibacillus gelatini]